MPVRGIDHSQRRRRGLGGLLGGGGRCGRGGAQRGRQIVGLGTARGREFLGRPGVSMGLGLGCRRCLGRGELVIVIVGAGVDVDAGAGGMVV